MAEADDALNYQGVFILLKADELMTMRVEHGVDERGVWESIEALNGEHRRIVRNNDEVVSVYPERKLITISHAHSKSSLHPSLPENIDKLSQYYRIKQLENDRIANRETVVIDVQPNDNFRYGYRYWIDDATGVLLKCDLLNEAGEVIEQMMFTSMSYMDELPATAFGEPSREGYTVRKLDEQRSVSENSDWSVTDLPSGFVLMQSSRREHRNSSSLHMIYSDGLASVSVFIEPDEKGYHHLDGVSSMGALNVFGTKVDDYSVTVMGEVPASTVLQIANSTRRDNKTVHSDHD
jgi:sigma-E factor negative regulatory protein RseB